MIKVVAPASCIDERFRGGVYIELVAVTNGSGAQGAKVGNQLLGQLGIMSATRLAFAHRPAPASLRHTD